MLNILYINIKKEFLEAIISGQKDTEYRDITPFWISRLCENAPDGALTLKKYDQIHFRAGMNKVALEAYVKHIGTVVENVVDDRPIAALTDDEYFEQCVFAIQLGEVVEVRNGER